MPDTAPELYEEVKGLAAKPKPDFLELADRLRDLCHADKKTFASLWVENNRILTRRRAIYLRDIARARGKIEIPKDALIAIGWMKSWLILRWAKKSQSVMPPQEFTDALNRHLEIAGQNGITVRKFRAHLNGAPDFGKLHCVLLYFNDHDHAIYKKSILAHGGAKLDRGSGLVGQEQALMRIIAKSARRQFPKLPR